MADYELIKKVKSIDLDEVNKPKIDYAVLGYRTGKLTDSSDCLKKMYFSLAENFAH